MSGSATNEERVCALCDRVIREWLSIDRFSTQSCSVCATRLGRLLTDAPEALASIWPSLIEEDTDEPEPRVRMPDGSSVELRTRTAELKKELTIEARLKLAHTYGELGLHREQVLECGTILSLEPGLAIAQGALDLLMTHRFVAPDAIERLRPAMFPA
ncbi:MAG: hypothetical protein IRZ16_12995 [Myxococcaceae bacterium]|nr:hypothetical protein [Myxococcaceae bacterium]